MSTIVRLYRRVKQWFERRKIRATLTFHRLVRKPEFIDLNDLEQMCNRGNGLIMPVCLYSTVIKRDIPIGRVVGKDEYHLIKDWFALIPNKEAKDFAEWLLVLANRAHHERFNEEYPGLPSRPKQPVRKVLNP